jgi:hypothetical protein
MKNLKVGDLVSTKSVFKEHRLFLIKEICERKVTLENFDGSKEVVNRKTLKLFYNKVTDNEKMFVNFISENLKNHLIRNQYNIYFEKMMQLRDEFEKSIKGL